jgi:hypothetical protein
MTKRPIEAPRRLHIISRLPARLGLLALVASCLAAVPVLAQPAPPPPAEDCGCGVPDSPRGPR